MTDEEFDIYMDRAEDEDLPAYDPDDERQTKRDHMPRDEFGNYDPSDEILAYWDLRYG